MAVPDDRCGYTVEYESLNSFHPERTCCYRRSWRDGRCIWHADVVDKPVEKLKESRLDQPEHLAGAVLTGTTVDDELSFAGCQLYRADLSDARFRDANFSNANLLRADLVDADFVRANFTEAEAWEITASESNFLESDFTEAAVIRSDFSGANFGGADLTNANLSDVSLSGADLSSADLSDASVRIADLSGVFAQNANLSYADFEKSDLSDANFTDANARGAVFEAANLTRTNFFGADLTGSDTYGAVLSDIQINRKTQFGKHYTYALDSDDPVDVDGSSPTAWDKARWTYRQAERLARDNALPERAREYYVTRKNVRRREYRRLGGLANRYRWAKAVVSWAVMEYGENPRRVVGFSLAIILGFGVAFPFFGGMTSGETQSAVPYAFDPITTGSIPLPEWLVVLLANLYFSGVTFTTLGYGDIQPATPAVEVMATVESFLGALLMALLVFVLGRRTTW